jgi:hypothetical protein
VTIGVEIKTVTVVTAVFSTNTASCITQTNQNGQVREKDELIKKQNSFEIFEDHHRIKYIIIENLKLSNSIYEQKILM